ncbi:MAG: hypothetical protein QOI29_3871 [Mycobacterium sp.]|jgi:hypothetical protein|nr:hypothetical protein [Mycobacterium sp.]
MRRRCDCDQLAQVAIVVEETRTPASGVETIMDNDDYPSTARKSVLDNAFAVAQTRGGASL